MSVYISRGKGVAHSTHKFASAVWHRMSTSPALPVEQNVQLEQDDLRGGGTNTARLRPKYVSIGASARGR